MGSTIIKNIYRFIFYCGVKILSGIPLKNKVLCLAYNGKGVSCNPKYIAMEIHKQLPKVEIYWGVKSISEEDKTYYKKKFPYIKLVNIRSLSFWYHLATSKVWVNNRRISSFWPKRKNQFYIQTWHGGTFLKKVEADAMQSLPETYIKDAKYDSKIADLFLASSERERKLYRKTFWYNGEILNSGHPRIDVLLSRERVKIGNELRKKFDIANNEVAILYAPTFRQSLDLSVYDIDFQQCLTYFEKKYSCKCKLFVRLHPNFMEYDISNWVNQLPENVIDVTAYPDMQDLLIMSDVLITDYSSSMFDFGIMKKPVFLYVSDLESYKKERDTYISLEDTPFLLTRSNEELCNKIISFSEKEYRDRVEQFYRENDEFNTGHASEKVVSYIIKRGILK